MKTTAIVSMLALLATTAFATADPQQIVMMNVAPVHEQRQYQAIFDSVPFFADSLTHISATNIMGFGPHAYTGGMMVGSGGVMRGRYGAMVF